MTKLQIVSTVIQWLLIIAIGIAIYLFFSDKLPFEITGTLNGAEVILFALSISFALVEVAHIFPCMKCVTAWVALILALLFHTPFAWLYLFVGLIVGAVFSSIKMRWL